MPPFFDEASTIRYISAIMRSSNFRNILRCVGISIVMTTAVRPSIAKTQAELLIDNGVDLVHEGRLDESITLFKKALILEPRNATGHYDLGMAYYKKEQFAKARLCLQKAVECDANMPKAWNELASVFVRLKDFQNAESAQKKACTIKPCCKYFNNLAKLYLQLGKLEEGRMWLIKAKSYPEANLPEYSDINENLKILDEKLHQGAGK